jgi:hypothetical protein
MNMAITVVMLSGALGLVPALAQEKKPAPMKESMPMKEGMSMKNEGLKAGGDAQTHGRIDKGTGHDED